MLCTDLRDYLNRKVKAVRSSYSSLPVQNIRMQNVSGFYETSGSHSGEYGD
jgi:hypothetical protein